MQAPNSGVSGADQTKDLVTTTLHEGTRSPIPCDVPDGFARCNTTHLFTVMERRPLLWSDDLVFPFSCGATPDALRLADVFKN